MYNKIKNTQNNEIDTITNTIIIIMIIIFYTLCLKWNVSYQMIKRMTFTHKCMMVTKSKNTL